MARKKTKPPPKKVEFSKLILLLVMFSYFLIVGVGIHLCYIDASQYSTLAALVGGPTAVAIVFYAWKAKCENIVKYRKENKKDAENLPFDPANIS